MTTAYDDARKPFFLWLVRRLVRGMSVPEDENLRACRNGIVCPQRTRSPRTTTQLHEGFRKEGVSLETTMGDRAPERGDRDEVLP